MNHDFEPTEKSPQSTADEVENIIRRRAYELYEKRGGMDGFALDDWTQAEAEVLEATTVPKIA